MTKKSSATHPSSKNLKKTNVSSAVHQSTTEQATNDGHVKTSKTARAIDSSANNTHAPLRFANDQRPRYEEGEPLHQVSEQDSQSQQGYDSTQNIRYAPQLHQWAYNVSDSDLPFTEKLEKSKWKEGQS